MSLPPCLWFLFCWTVLNAKEFEEKEAGQCGVCFPTVFPCISSMQYLLNEYSTSFRNSVTEMILWVMRKDIFFLKDHVTSVGNYFWWFVFLTFLKISLEWSSEYSLSPPAARAWLPAGSFLWLIPGDGWDRDSRLVFPLRGPLQPCWLKCCCREWMGWVRRKSFVVCNARCRWCSCFGLLSMSATTWS